MQNKIVFRFDIDTAPGIRGGMPRLLDILDERGVRATFYVNMGRAISRRDSLRKLLAPPGRNKRLSAPKLSASQKIGALGVLEALIRNPFVGGRAPDILRRAVAEGHEVGLHGGRSHGLWQWGAHDFHATRIREEVEWGMDRLSAVLDVPVEGFSSPGWASPASLPEIIRSMGFSYLADSHDPDREGVFYDPEKGLWCLNTNLAGEPGGVGFFETVAARGGGKALVREMLREKLQQFEHVALYDHPAFSGGDGIHLVATALDVCSEMGGSIVTASEMIAAHAKGGSNG